MIQLYFPVLLEIKHGQGTYFGQWKVSRRDMNLAGFKSWCKKNKSWCTTVHLFPPFTVLHCVPDVTPSLAQGSDKETWSRVSGQLTVDVQYRQKINLCCYKPLRSEAYLLPQPNLALEKAMAPHSSTLAWKIPWTEEPGRLQSMGSLRVGLDWATSLSLFTLMHWRRKWQPTPVFLPGESQGQGSLVGCRLWGRTESDTTEAT